MSHPLYRQKQTLFDRWAGFYDWSFPSVFYQAVHRRLLDYVELPIQFNGQPQGQLSRQFPEPMPGQLPHQSPGQPPGPVSVLDLGCGTGKLLKRLAQSQVNLTGLGLDLSPEMIAQARRANPFPERLQYQVGNATALPCADGSCDRLFNSISFLHYPEPGRVLAEVRRVLKPDGVYYLADFAPRWASEPVILAQQLSPIRFYSPTVREQLAAQAGLRVLGHNWLLGPVVLTRFGL